MKPTLADGTKKQRLIVYTARTLLNLKRSCGLDLMLEILAKPANTLVLKEAMKELRRVRDADPSATPTETNTAAAAHAHVTEAMVEFVQLKSPIME